MSFVHWHFPLFFAVVLALYWPLRRRRRAQNAVLLAASLVFYGWVHPWFLALIAFSTLLDFGVGLGMAARPQNKRGLLALSLVGNLGMLGVFKYLDWFIEQAAAVGLGNPSTLGILLPVGISFFTFQTLSYSFDVYRGKLEPRRNLLDYATYVCMFPQLVAGPIERARDLLPQVEAERSPDRMASGLTLALWGAVKKVVVADTIGLYVDRVFVMDAPGGWMVWAATLGFAVQILADFSGYTDMARGAARMLGFELSVNFKRPYQAISPSDFWRRWHISLSSWIHEYVYVPFGGSKHGWVRTAAATVGAMGLSGLWHGADWRYVIWGGYHAALLLIWRGWRRVVPEPTGRARRALNIAGVFALVSVGWLIFREPDVSELLGHVTRNPLRGSWDEQVAAAVVGSVALVGAAIVGLGESAGDRLRKLDGWRVPAMTTLWALALVCIVLFARDTSRDFIYFRF